jgi:hypothetical protein
VSCFHDLCSREGIAGICHDMDISGNKGHDSCREGHSLDIC